MLSRIRFFFSASVNVRPNDDDDDEGFFSPLTGCDLAALLADAADAAAGTFGLLAAVVVAFGCCAADGFIAALVPATGVVLCADDEETDDGLPSAPMACFMLFAAGAEGLLFAGAALVRRPVGGGFDTEARLELVLAAARAFDGALSVIVVVGTVRRLTPVLVIFCEVAAPATLRCVGLVSVVLPLGDDPLFERLPLPC